MIAAGASLQLDRARLSGPAASRAMLAEGLAQVPLSRLALGDDELLLIPHHRSRAVLRARADGGLQSGFGMSLVDELAMTLARAAVDPPPGARAGAYRFTSRRRFAIWLLGSWVSAGPTTSALPDPLHGLMLADGSPLGWARRMLFDDGPALPPVFAALARHGLAAAVLARLDTGDVARLTRAVQVSHGLMLVDLAAPEAVNVRAVGAVSATGGDPPPSADGQESPVQRRAIALAATAAAAGNDLAALPKASAVLLLALLHLDDDPTVPRAALATAAAEVVTTQRAVGASVNAPNDRAPGSATAAMSQADQPVLRLSPAPPPTAVVRPDGVVPIPASGFASDFAGLLFLLNAFLAMGLYPDFTRPGDAGLALAPTRLLDRLAVHWFGKRYRDDRLHLALAAVDSDAALPDRWQVAPDWLAAFPEPAVEQPARSRRHRPHWHPAGFPLVDDLQHERRRTREARWLRCLALYLDARIRRAADDPKLGLDSLAIPGRCRFDAQRIDIDIALVDLPLPLRLAGLDRDPGWIPAEGRSIALHFQ